MNHFGDPQIEYYGMPWQNIEKIFSKVTGFEPEHLAVIALLKIQMSKCSRLDQRPHGNP
jgi:hypothetical protein